MNEQELREQVIEALVKVAPEIDPSGIQPQVAFRDQFEMDSVDYLNFVLTLEQRLDVKVPEPDYPKLSTLAGCVRYLGTLLDGGGDHPHAVTQA